MCFLSAYHLTKIPAGKEVPKNSAITFSCCLYFYQHKCIWDKKTQSIL